MLIMIRPLGLALASALLLSGLPARALASGRAEKPGDEQLVALTLLVIGPASSASSAPSLSATLPMEIAPYLWNTFVHRSGLIETTADERYRVDGSIGTSRERLDDLQLQRVELRAATPPRPGAKTSTLRFDFDLAALLGSDGSVLFQPGQYALAQAIRESGLASGEARVLSVRRTGARRFSAEVLVR